ncbi:MAG: hypothetical protein IJ863_05010 [Spirochaetales bacterium]|nr:hypothetical protein [Spirochaetales bacterium]
MDGMYGVKLYDPRFCTDRTIDLMEENGFNTVYLGRDALVPEFTEELSRRGFFWNIVEPVFLASEGEDLAVLEDGSPASDSWVRFACPSDAGHLGLVSERISSDIEIFDPPGISLDFMRFFQFWEMTRPSADPSKLPASCFCPRCRKQLEGVSDVGSWRQMTIGETADRLCSEARRLKPKLRIGIHCVPWKRDLYDGAIMEIIGQNFADLAKIGDYLTPMIYHHMMHREPSYITELMDDMVAQGCKSVLPSIQVREGYRTDTMGAAEFAEALERALESPSMGVLLYKWEDIADDSVRLKAVRSALRGF